MRKSEYEMIGRIELENYRGFRQYKLSSLARVNLLVGKNNSGKTSILEAVHLLASGGDPRILSQIARQRGEILYDIEDRETRRTSWADVSHFFFAHTLGQNAYFSVNSDDALGKISVSVGPIPELTTGEGQGLLFDELNPRTLLGLRIEGDKTPSMRGVPIFPVTEDGAFSFDQAIRTGRLGRLRVDERSVLFISQDSLQRNSMSEMWDRVVTDGREQDVVKAMQILEPTLSSIVFLSGERSYRYETRGGILVGFEGSKKRFPLGSHGEGMRRLLALSLSLANTHGGILLIDEIDTGLHYSIMGDMWLLVVEAAKRYGIQVFVTTHSFDCVRGLAWLCRHHPDLQTEVSLQKVERDLDEAVALDAEQIQIAVDQGLEVR